MFCQRFDGGEARRGEFFQFRRLGLCRLGVGWQRDRGGQFNICRVVAPRGEGDGVLTGFCLLYTSPSPRDMRRSRMPSSA